MAAAALVAAFLAPAAVYGQVGTTPAPGLVVGPTTTVQAAPSVLAEPTITPEPSESSSPSPTGSETPTPTISAVLTPTPTPPPGLVPLATTTPSEALRNAHDTSQEDRAEKLWEARHRCLAAANPMLSTGGFTALPPPPPRPGFPFVWLIAAACVGIGAALWRRHLRRRGRSDTPERKADPLPWLEAAALVVGSCAAVWGVAVRVDPHLAPPPRPAKSATMVVRTVNARIEHVAFAKEAGTAPAPASLASHEVGNVVWLELHLRGYSGSSLYLQWASYESRSGGALVPETERELSIRPGADDIDAFQPVWVGYPMLPRFRVQFRLLEDGQVRQIAATSGMDGDVPRYVCQATWPKAK